MTLSVSHSVSKPPLILASPETKTKTKAKTKTKMKMKTKTKTLGAI